MFIQDPESGFSIPDPESWLSIPDPGVKKAPVPGFRPTTKNLLSSRKYDKGCLSRFQDFFHPGFRSRILESGVKKTLDPGSASEKLL
jgi:hypothetical protein